MPRYYCDYCDTYLTHDSPSVRKQHNAGYKHKANIRAYYQKFEEQQTQTLIDQKIKEHLGQAAAFQQVGAAYNQHLASYSGRSPVPMIPPPMLPIPGAAAPQMVPGVRPPILSRPLVPGVQGYGVLPMMAPVAGHPPTASTLPMQANNLPNPSIISPPATVPGGVPISSSNGAPPAIMQTTHQGNTSGNSALPANTTAGTYNYTQAPDGSN